MDKTAEDHRYAEAIDKWRQFRGLSKSALAVLVSALRRRQDCRNHVSQICNGKKVPSKEYLLDFMTCLEVTSEEAFFSGPSAVTGPPWRIHSVGIIGTHAKYLTQSVELSAEPALAGEVFVGFIRNLRSCHAQTESSVPIEQFLGLDNDTIDSLGECVHQSHLLQVVATTNTWPSDLPMREEACKEVQGILLKLGWRPHPSGDLFSWLKKTFEVRLDHAPSVIYLPVRKRYARVSALWLVGKSQPERMRIAELARAYHSTMMNHLRDNDPSKDSNALAQAALLAHVNFHAVLLPKESPIEAAELEQYRHALLHGLRAGTERCRVDQHMQRIFGKQHQEIIHLLEQEELAFEEVMSWYGREHAFAIVPTISELSQAS